MRHDLAGMLHRVAISSSLWLLACTAKLDEVQQDGAERTNPESVSADAKSASQPGAAVASKRAPKRVDQEPVPTERGEVGNPPPPIDWIESDGELLRAGEQTELFVMLKVGPADMQGTDPGWIYGTLSPTARRSPASA